MTAPFADDDEPTREVLDLAGVLHRLRVLEQNQRDMLFLLRTLRHALRVERLAISAQTRRLHREVIRLPPFNGLCPCCLHTEVVAADGSVIPPAEYDHFWGPTFSAPVHSWLICLPCHRELTTDGHLVWYRRLVSRFRQYQAAVEAHARAFGPRTPAKLYSGRHKP